MNETLNCELLQATGECGCAKVTKNAGGGQNVWHKTPNGEADSCSEAKSCRIEKPGAAKRNGSIEILRFVFANLVVWHHALLPLFKGGWLGVEFFFILSGLFMAKGLDKNKDRYATEPMSVTVKESSRYLLKRYMAIFPYMVISTLLGFLVLALNQNFGTTFRSVVKHMLHLPYELFFMQNYGFASISCIGTVWYLSAMFFAIWILYPIIRRYYDLYVGYLAPMVAIFLTGYLMRVMGTLGGACDWLSGGLNSGFVRAVAEISWGAFLYKHSSALSKQDFTAKMKNLLTIAESASYIVVLVYISLWKHSWCAVDPVIVMVMSFGVVITTSGQSRFCGKLDNRFTTFLGKISMVMFMNHAYWVFSIVSLARRMGSNASELSLKLLGVILSYVTTIVVYYLGQTLVRRVKRR